MKELVDFRQWTYLDQGIKSGGLNDAVPLGRAYDWSIQYGEGTAYHLGRIGVRMRRLSDREYNPETAPYPYSGCHAWQSERNTLITWMRRTCLGLEDSESKTYDPVRADWIISAPEPERVAFLHGLCDGDGCASVKAQFLSIATSINTKFFQDLLASFRIASHKGDGAIAVNAKSSVQRAAEVGIFRYATSRRENLEKLAKMIDSIDNSRNLTSEQITLAKAMRREGQSWGAISEEIFDRCGYTWAYYAVKGRAEKHGIY